MKRPIRMAFLGVWLGAVVVQAQTQTETSPGAASTSAPQATLTGPQVQAEILSIDAAGKKITVRESAAAGAADTAAKTAATLPVEGNASLRLGVVKAGDRVTLICAGPGAAPTTTTAPATQAPSEAPASVPPSTTTSGSSTDSTSGTASTGATGTASDVSTEASGAPAAGVDTASTGKTTASAPVVTAGDSASQTGLNATCGSVVEIAKARATTSPQQ